jgi:hypothetical protein
MSLLFYRTARWAQVFLAIVALCLALSGQTAAQELSPATKKLFEAVHNGDLAQVQISIAGGADPEALNTWGISAVDLAVDKGHFDIVHFLLQVREMQAQKGKPAPVPSPARVTSLSNPAPVPAKAEALQPVPIEPGAVAEVYTPPLGSGPWSATVVTTEPPPPAPNQPDGPSPFDKGMPIADASLPIIGDVRGPATNTRNRAINTGVPASIEDTFQESTIPPVVKAKPAPAPVPEKATQEKSPEVASIPTTALKAEPPAKKDDGIWGNIKSFLNLDTPLEATPPPPAPAPAPKSIATAKPVPIKPVEFAAAPIAKPMAPVSLPDVEGAPPPIAAKIFPKPVTPAKVSDLSQANLKAPKVMAVQKKPAAPVTKKNGPTPPNTSVGKVTRITKPSSATFQQIARNSPPIDPVQVGATIPPGKPQDNKRFFSRVMSVFSSDKEKKADKDKKPAAKKDPIKESGDWRVKEIQQAKVVPKKPSKKAARKLPEKQLDGVILSIGRTTALSKAPPPQTPAPWFNQSCINKKLGSTIFCIESLDWPEDIRAFFLTDSILYEGTQTIVRYDEGAATYFHTLFPSKSYTSIVNFFTRRYGPPTQKLKRSIAPLAEQRRINPTTIWQSITPVTNLLTTLEVRMYDDNRGGFPDTKRGAVYLYHEWSQPIFPQLSSVELMLLRAVEKQH